MEKAGEVNVYVCKDCRHYAVTVNRESGVTPFTIRCPNCGATFPAGGAVSLLYPPFAERRFGTPQYEWRDPDADGVLRLARIGE
jgi:hypothetical protein